MELIEDEGRQVRDTAFEVKEAPRGRDREYENEVTRTRSAQTRSIGAVELIQSACGPKTGTLA